MAGLVVLGFLYAVPKALAEMARSMVKRNLRPIHEEFTREQINHPELSEKVSFYRILRNPVLTEEDCSWGNRTIGGDLSRLAIAKTIGKAFADRILPSQFAELNKELDRCVSTAAIRDLTIEAQTETRTVIRLQCILMIEGGGDRRPPSDIVFDAAEHIVQAVQRKTKLGRDLSDPCIYEFLDIPLLLRMERSRTPRMLTGTDAFENLMRWFRRVRRPLNDRIPREPRGEARPEGSETAYYNRIYAEIIRDKEFVPTKKLRTEVVERAVSAGGRPMGPRDVLECVRLLEHWLFAGGPPTTDDTRTPWRKMPAVKADPSKWKASFQRRFQQRHDRLT